MLLYSRLTDAKRGCLQREGVSNPSPSAICKAITKEELSHHCRRRTRGAEVTLQLIEALLLQLSTATDSLGVLVFSEQMIIIWQEEKQHMKCIQDPAGMTLYTVTEHITKGGVELPVLRCGRGTTLLESFHLHLARYVSSWMTLCHITCELYFCQIHPRLFSKRCQLSRISAGGPCQLEPGKGISSCTDAR